MASTNGNVKKYGNNKDLLNEEQQEVLRNKENKIERLKSEINHLSKPLSQSEGSLNWSKHVTPATLSIFQDEKSWSGFNNVDIKRKSNIKEFKDMNGLAWNNMKDSMHLDSEDDNYSESGSPVTTRLDAKDMDIFGAMPMEEDIVVVKCNNCQRPLLASKFKEHSESCISKASKQKDFFSDDEEIDLRKNMKKKKKATTLEDELNIPSTTAKRPPSASLEKNEKKKMKKEKQKKTIKQKAPLDLDKQCGVIQGLNNLPCTRSLTCKSHSMGAKRAVEGRSQPYDVLLAAYQKKSIGRPNGKEVLAKKKASTPSTVANTTTSSGKSIKNLKKLQQVASPSGTSNGSNSLNSKSNLALTQTNEETFIDSDEEVENVMQALRLSRPTPLAQKPFFFVKRKRQCYRLRDILLDAITPKSMISNDNSSSLLATDSFPIRQPFFQQQQQQQQQQSQHQQPLQQSHTNLGYNNAMVPDNTTLFGKPTSSSVSTSFSVR